MAGLCEGGNEHLGSLKARKNRFGSFNKRRKEKLLILTTQTKCHSRNWLLLLELERSNDTPQGPCDFDLFPKMKLPLRGVRFRTRRAITAAVEQSVRRLVQQDPADGIRHLPENLKLRSGVMNSCILPVLLYGAQTWSLTERERDMLRKCQREMERRMLNITLRYRLRNEDIRSQTHLNDAAKTAEKLKKKWAGHVMRFNASWWTHPYDMRPNEWQTQRWKTEDKVGRRT
ncbi:hypothetical protein ANN_04215 [Periplaneta americana]|uniref:Uncharacterized protein n=1 Tax=Periplaneta americana TaxID=6978 RepID=A0ABQ8T951_PERAM|nr:hypothetical protein ANN_04215 [Periplaneta americana]